MANLFETMDGVLALYAPLLTRMMTANPGFAGLETCIGRDDPVAWPTANVDPGHAADYSDEDFELQAAEFLQALVEPTYKLTENCPVIAETDEPISLLAARQEGNPNGPGEITITTIIGDNRGGVSATRSVACIDTLGLFHSYPATLMITTAPNLTERQISDVTALSKGGLAAVSVYLEENGLILNWKRSDRRELMAWVEAFPKPGEIRIENLGQGIHRLHVSSGFQMDKLFATDDYAAKKLNPDYESFGVMPAGRIGTLPAEADFKHGRS